MSRAGIAVVTGAANGIGYAIASELAREGHAIAVVDMNQSAAEESATKIARSTGARVCTAQADVTDFDACERAYQKVVDVLGAPTILVNNAGIVVRKKGRLEDIPQAHIDEMMAIHVNGSLNWSRLVIPAMREAKYGRIVNISSVNAVAAVPYRLSYVTAKKAVRGVTEALALETARAGITVNAIAPGYILTDVLKKRAAEGILDKQAIADRTPVGRWGEVEDIADAVAYLASDKAGFITGTTMVVDGGLSIRGDANDDLDNPPI